MARRQPLVLLLWGDQFDEAAAAIFVSALRAAGVQVRVVGVDGRTASGRHGLQVSADLTLHRALALSNRVTHVVLPCAVSHFHRLREDPLVTRLLGESAAAGAHFLVSVQPESCTGCNVLPLPAAAPSLPLERLRAYPERALEFFASTMALEMRSAKAE